MNWKLCFSLVLKEFKKRISFNTFFILNLSLGLVGLIMVNSFQDSIQNHLEENLKSSLGADITIVSQQPIKPEEETIIESMTENVISQSNKVQFFSMIRTNKRSKLVQVIAVDDQFPLYGTFKLLGGENLNFQFPNNVTQNLAKIWMIGDSRFSLGVSTGDQVSIGSTDFTVGTEIEPQSSASILSLSFAPKVYIQKNFLQKTDLIQKGSRISYIKLLRLKNPSLAKEIATELKLKFSDVESNIRVRTYLNANNQISNILTQASNYLSMLSLIALLLAGVGAAYLYRGYIMNRFNDMAILISLGFKRQEIFLIYLSQTLILGFIATVFALIFSKFTLPIADDFLQTLKLGMVELKLSYNSMFIALMTGLAGSIAFCFPSLMQIQKLKPKILLTNSSNLVSKIKHKKGMLLITYLPTLLFIWLISVYQSSVGDGSLFLLLFFMCLGGLGFWGWLFILVIRWLSNHIKHTITLLALRNISRHQWSSIASFVTLGLGVFLMSIIPQIHSALEKEIDSSGQLKVPGLFVFDVQQGQLDKLKTLVKSNDESLSFVTPMVSARLKSINGKSPNQRWFEREDSADNSRSITSDREVRLTYRSHLLQGETIEKGTMISSMYEGTGGKEDPLELSVEKRFSERVETKLGDVFEFTVQGIKVYGKITSIRKVKWTSFQPNFFIVIQPGLLEYAPQTYLASIAKSSIEKRTAMQDIITDEFPNISVIDVAELVEQVLKITSQLTTAITMIAIFSVLVGLLIIYSITHTETKQKKQEMNLFKVLGGTKAQMYQIFVLEFSLITGLGSFFGIVLSLLSSSALATYIFDTNWLVNWQVIVFTFIMVNIITIIITVISTKNVINQKAWRIFTE